MPRKNGKFLTGIIGAKVSHLPALNGLWGLWQLKGFFLNIKNRSIIDI